MTKLPVGHSGRGERGTALVFAVALLFVFSLFGAAYMKFAFLELEESNFDLSRLRAEQAAEAGVQAALGHLRAAEASGQLDQLLGIENLYDFPVYKQTAPPAPGAAPAGLPETLGVAAVDNRAARAAVTIADESARVNLNHAPASVLQGVLGVDGATARAITASLPRGEAGEGEWLLGLEDLVARGLLTQEQLAQVKPELVTTLSVTDHAQPGFSFNINGAAPEVLAAVLNMPLNEAESLARRGPFKSMEQLVEASGRQPETFNVATGAEGGSMLAFAPGCFRISSTGTYSHLTQAGGDALRMTSRVEAVVRRDATGGYEVVYWHGASGQKAETTPAADGEAPVADGEAPTADAGAAPAVESAPVEEALPAGEAVAPAATSAETAAP
jgi:DNA uptake protein ComE-like DNA-binding protein